MTHLSAHIWSGHFNRQPGSVDRCRAGVADGGRSPMFHQCRRKPVVFREIDDPKGTFGFCRAHDPVFVAQKRADRDAKWRMEWAERDARREAIERRKLAAEKCVAALREIEAGHNDPRTLARETLAALDAAQGIEAATAAETVEQGSVHESPVGESRCAQTAPKGAI